jgi:hypothetical protein
MRHETYYIYESYEVEYFGKHLVQRCERHREDWLNSSPVDGWWRIG